MARVVGIVLCGFVICWAMTPSVAAQSRQSQAAIAQQLLNEDTAERSNALEAVRRIGLANASPEVRSALVKALEREAMLHRLRYVADRRGENPAPLDDPEFLIRLASAVAELRDPASIPALAASLGSGFAVIRPLAAFGEQAVPAVLAVEGFPESSPAVIGDALITLRFIVEGASTRGGVSEATRTALHRVAARRLSSGEGLALTPLCWAIDLAWVLQDNDLRQRIEALATDPNVIIAKGITDPGLIEQTQRRAADRVAGVPPLPRP